MEVHRLTYQSGVAKRPPAGFGVLSPSCRILSTTTDEVFVGVRANAACALQTALACYLIKKLWLGCRCVHLEVADHCLRTRVVVVALPVTTDQSI